MFGQRVDWVIALGLFLLLVLYHVVFFVTFRYLDQKIPGRWLPRISSYSLILFFVLPLFLNGPLIVAEGTVIASYVLAGGLIIYFVVVTILIRIGHKSIPRFFIPRFLELEALLCLCVLWIIFFSTSYTRQIVF